MNLVWIAGLTLFVALEKFAPFGEAIAKATSVALVGASLFLVLA